MLSRSTGIISRLSVTRCLNIRKSKWIIQGPLHNKVYYFEIYYSEESAAGTSYKYQSFYELSDNDLESISKSTFQKLVYGLENEDSDISYMFCSPNLEVHISYYYNHIPYWINILGNNSQKVEVVIGRRKKIFWRKFFRRLRYCYQKVCFCQWPAEIYRG